MKQARHNDFGHFILNPYIDSQLTKYFSHFYLVNDMPVIPSNRSLIITANHTSWWDGFFIYSFARRFINKKIHMMMLEERLKRHWYFRHLGAYSIQPGQRQDVLDSFAYTIKILKHRSNMVVVYPQGEIIPFWMKPVKFKPGLKYILSKKYSSIASFTEILILGSCIYFHEEMKPQIVMRFGDILSGEWVSRNYFEFRKKFRDNLDALVRAVETRSFKEDIFLQYKF